MKWRVVGKEERRKRVYIPSSVSDSVTSSVRLDCVRGCCTSVFRGKIVPEAGSICTMGMHIASSSVWPVEETDASDEDEEDVVVVVGDIFVPWGARGGREELSVATYSIIHCL